MRSTIQPTLICVLALFAALSTRSVDAQQLHLDFERVENGVTQRNETTKSIDSAPSRGTLISGGTVTRGTVAGSSAKWVTESYTVQVPYTENVTQTYTVQVPYTEAVTQKYTVKVPYIEKITGEDGTEKEVQKTRTEQRERVVPVMKTRTETRTRVVPVTKTRMETRTRRVPVGKKIEIPFPPTNASFAYVSGKKITLEQIKAIAAKDTITILRLSGGQTLTELHRQALKPDLIVMTIAPDTNKPLEIAKPKEKKGAARDKGRPGKGE